MNNTEEIREIERIKGDLKTLESVMKMYFSENAARWKRQEKLNEEIKEEFKEVKKFLDSLWKKLTIVFAGLYILSIIFQIILRFWPK
jgi:hypothetical protein